jgi:hypothetical protein
MEVVDQSLDRTRSPGRAGSVGGLIPIEPFAPGPPLRRLAAAGGRVARRVKRVARPVKRAGAAGRAKRRAARAVKRLAPAVNGGA